MHGAYTDAMAPRAALVAVLESPSLVSRPRPAFRRFSVLQATESWAGPGNEAKNLLLLPEQWSCIFY